MIVLDTNIVSEFSLLRPDRNVSKWLERQDTQQLFLCIPVIAELAFGAQRVLIKDKNIRHQNALEGLLRSRFRNRILQNDLPSALRYGSVVAYRASIGRPIGPMDAMIAAICLVHGATLATRNVRDFEGLDLSLVNPFEAAS